MADVPETDSGTTLMPTHEDSRPTSQTEDVPATEDAPATGTPSEAAQVDLKRIEDTQTALKEKQSEFHAETSRMREEIAKLQGVKEALLAQPTTPEPEVNWTELYDDNPLAATQQMMAAEMKKMRDEVVALQEEKDQIIASYVDSRTSPERRQLEPVIAQLAGEGWFLALPPSKQLEAARTYSKSMSSSPSLEPDELSPAGTGRRSTPPVEDPALKRKEVAQEIARNLWPDRTNSNVITVGEG